MWPTHSSLVPISTQPAKLAQYLATAHIEHKLILRDLVGRWLWALEVELEGSVGSKVSEVLRGTQLHPRAPVELHGHLDLCAGCMAHQHPTPSPPDTPLLALVPTLLAAPRAWAMSSRTRPMLADRARLALCPPRFSSRFSLASNCGSVFSRVDTAGERREGDVAREPRFPRPTCSHRCCVPGGPT